MSSNDCSAKSHFLVIWLLIDCCSLTTEYGPLKDYIFSRATILKTSFPGVDNLRCIRVVTRISW